MKVKFTLLWGMIDLTLGDDFRARGHAAFDVLWKDGYFKSRNRAYKWLAEELGIPQNACHFSLFSKGECEKVIEVCNDYARRVDHEEYEG